MSDYDGWVDAQNAKLERIKKLLHEIAYTQQKMQSLLNEATIKCQAERGLKDLEHYLGRDK